MSCKDFLVLGDKEENLSNCSK